MNLIDVDFAALALQCVPPAWRTLFWAGYMRVATAPLAWLHSQFVAFVADAARRRAYNAQCYKLELLLATEYGPTPYAVAAPAAAPGREIFIQTVADTLPFQYLFTAAEAIPQHVYTAAEAQPWPLYTYAEYLTAHDFIIYVPAPLWAALGPDGQQRFRAQVDTYRLAATRYVVVTY
jgi:hypothetical protein